MSPAEATDLGAALYGAPDPHPATQPQSQQSQQPSILESAAPPPKAQPRSLGEAMYGKPADWENHPDNPNRRVYNTDTHAFGRKLAEEGHIPPLQAVELEQRLNAELRTLNIAGTVLQAALRDSAKPIAKMTEAEQRSKVAVVNKALADAFGVTGAEQAAQDAREFLAKHPTFAATINGTLASLSSDLTVRLAKAARAEKGKQR